MRFGANVSIPLEGAWILGRGFAAVEVRWSSRGERFWENGSVSEVM
jgi:hypothetical protein